MPCIGTNLDRANMGIPITEVDKNLNVSQKDGNWASVWTGLTSSYVSPFAIAIGASNSTIGFLGSFPDLINSSCQLFASFVLRICKSRRNVISWLVAAQALVWLGFLAVPTSGPAAIPILVGLVAVNAVIAGLIYPIWNSLMGDIVPANRRGYFFAKRTRILGLCSFGSMLLAGAFLATWRWNTAWGFATLFTGAACARMLSSMYLKQMSDVPLDRSSQSDLTVATFVDKLRKGSAFGRFTLYAAFMKFAVSIANPFFAVYMLKELSLELCVLHNDRRCPCRRTVPVHSTMGADSRPAREQARADTDRNRIPACPVPMAVVT